MFNREAVDFVNATPTLTSVFWKLASLMSEPRVACWSLDQISITLIDKHFPKSSVLHQIFNRNSVKLSYSCMHNGKCTISNHNRCVLSNNMTFSNEETCYCGAESEFPRDGKCLTASIVYKAEITRTDTQETKENIAVTAGPLKDRYNNRKKSLPHFDPKKRSYQSTPGI